MFVRCVATESSYAAMPSTSVCVLRGGGTSPSYVIILHLSIDSMFLTDQNPQLNFGNIYFNWPKICHALSDIFTCVFLAQCINYVHRNYKNVCFAKKLFAFGYFSRT